MLYEVGLVVKVVNVLARVAHFAVPRHGVNISGPIQGVLPLHVFFPISNMDKKPRGLFAFFGYAKVWLNVTIDVITMQELDVTCCQEFRQQYYLLPYLGL
jgi:hypothetical protein